ncbi:MAG: hypothetical protein NG737_00055 [Omnitrophica bacterium]|nr:hypothetical protein [Candidatus Omnitrophota bacterium]
MKKLLWFRIILVLLFFTIITQFVYARRTASIARIARDESSDEISWVAVGDVILGTVPCDVQHLLDMSAQCSRCITLTTQGQCPDCCLVEDPASRYEKKYKCTADHNARYGCERTPFTCSETDMQPGDWTEFNDCSYLDGDTNAVPPTQTPLGPIDGAQPRGCPNTDPNPGTSDNDDARCERFPPITGEWHCTDPDIFPVFSGCRPDGSPTLSGYYRERFFKDVASTSDDYYKDPTDVLTGDSCPADFIPPQQQSSLNTDKKLAGLLMIPAGDPACFACTDSPCNKPNKHCLVKDSDKKCVKLKDIDDKVADGWFDCDNVGGGDPDPDPDPPDPPDPIPTCYQYVPDDDFRDYTGECITYTQDLERCLKEVSCCEANICCPDTWPDGTPQECSGTGFSFQENCSPRSCDERSDPDLKGVLDWDDEIGTLPDFQLPEPEHYCCGEIGLGKNAVSGDDATCATHSLDSGFCGQLLIMAEACLAGEPTEWDCTACYSEIDGDFFYEFVPKSGESFAIFWEVNSENPDIPLIGANQAYFFTRAMLYGFNAAGEEEVIQEHSSMLHQKDFTNAFTIFAGTNIDAGELTPGKTYRMRLEYFIPSVPNVTLTMKVLNMHFYVTRTRE